MKRRHSPEQIIKILKSVENGSRSPADLQEVEAKPYWDRQFR
jgi:hypothetical protein